ncbi:MAG: hypothetical protein ACXABY_02255 [Candidatus Thorarchaeota archaeon]|jgi:hypothetical protein
MPKDKKAIHDLFSPRIAEKRKRRHEAAKAAVIGKAGPPAPEEVDNYKVNKPLYGPHKIKKKANVPVVQRKLSPNEGKPTVNAKTGKAVKALVHKPRPVKPQIDPAIGAIDKAPPTEKKKKTRGRPRKKKLDAK